MKDINTEKKISHINKLVKNISRRIIQGEEVNLLVLHHNDLDGEAAYIVLQHIIETKGEKYNNFHIQECECLKNADDIEKIIVRYRDYFGYNVTDILIYDLSMNQDVSDMVEKIKNLKSIVMIDHHESAKSTSNKLWQLVIPHDETTLINNRTGSELAFDYYISRLIPIEDEDQFSYYKQFMKLVSIYDSFSWNNAKFNEAIISHVSYFPSAFDKIVTAEASCAIYNQTGKVAISECADKLNLLFKTLQLEAFREHVLSWMNKNSKLIDERVELIYQITKNNIKKAIETVEKHNKVFIVNKNTRLYVVQTCYTSMYQSEIGKYFYDKDNHIDIVFMVDMNSHSVSMRTNKEDINLAEIAKSLNGGGHPKAAGFQFDENMYQLDDIVSLIGTILY